MKRTGSFTTWKQVGSGCTICFRTVGETVIPETQEKLEARLRELQPALEEASRIQAALAALRGGGPAPPITVLDTLKPSPPSRD
jgi:hypothetical protein